VENGFGAKDDEFSCVSGNCPRPLVCRAKTGDRRGRLLSRGLRPDDGPTQTSAVFEAASPLRGRNPEQHLEIKTSSSLRLESAARTGFGHQVEKGSSVTLVGATRAIDHAATISVNRQGRLRRDHFRRPA